MLLMNLFKSKKIESITISELCEKADVSRRTFYRHFNTKEDLVRCYMLQLMTQLANALEPTLLENNTSQFAQAFFTFMLPHTKLIISLEHNNLIPIVFSCYIECLTPLSYHPSIITLHQEETLPAVNCKISYILGGLWSLLTFWIMNGCKQTPEQLADIVSSNTLLF